MKKLFSGMLVVMYVLLISLSAAPLLRAAEHGGGDVKEHGGTAEGEGGNKTVSEDANDNGILDPGEDLDGDGELDTALEVDAEGKPVAQEAKEHGGKEHGGQ